MAPTSRSAVISYSWDDEAHKAWVRGLAERLVLNGVKTSLDEWDVRPGDSITQFMEEKIQVCDHVLIICTPNYARKSITRVGGVGYEQQIISGSIASGVSRRKFIPILRTGDFSAHPEPAIPPHFQGIFTVDMRDDSALDKPFEKLLRAIWDEPEFAAPPLGVRPTFSSSSISSSAALRLATLEIDSWVLKSGVSQNVRFPKTFHVPSESERYNVNTGDLVQLMFGISLTKSEDDIEHERMLVIVTGTNGPYLTGTLDNDPVQQDANSNLKFGSPLVFLPEHIIKIMTRDELDFIDAVKALDEEVAERLWMKSIKNEDRPKFLEIARQVRDRKNDAKKGI